MIKELKIRNFKSINNLDIKFKKLNILCGENASGKTSIIHAILLCSQNEKNGKNLKYVLGILASFIYYC